MADCNDCIELEQDSCQGEKKFTECVVSKNAVPILGIGVNEPLDITIIKLSIIIQGLEARIQALENA